MIRWSGVQNVGRRLQSMPRERLYLYVLLFALALTNIHWRFCTSHYDYIPAEELLSRLESQCISMWRGGLLCQDECPPPDPRPQPVAVDESPVTGEQYAEIIRLASQRLNCTSRYHVSIVIPYRNRPEQLRVFLRHMLPLLWRQRVAYKIFVIEQTEKKPFNRGKLLNVGFMEASVEGFREPKGCFIFHDVDLLPEDAGNVYACSARPRHMSARVSSMRYQLPYSTIAGGVLAIMGETFERVNGYSNVYFGWGAEDDDFSSRLQAKQFQLTRPDPRVSRYQMLYHRPETPSQTRLQLLEEGAYRQPNDGLSNLTYHVQEREDRTAYQWILVDI